MTDWQEAEMGQQPAPTPTLSTDDLVLWIGEYAIKEKQQVRVFAYQQQKIQALENEILKAKSIAGGASTKTEELTAENNRLKTEISNLTSCLETVRNEQHSRFVLLEEQVHAIALERDVLVKELQIHTATIKQKKRGK